MRCRIPSLEEGGTAVHGFTMLTFGLAGFLGFFHWIWAFVDGIVIITGNVKDGKG